MTYLEFTRRQLNKYQPGVPIYTGDIAALLAAEFRLPQKEAAAATAVAIQRIKDSAVIPSLRFYQKGIYYRTAVTPFGEVNIDTERLIADKYLLPNEGYETGYSILYRMGLTTQIPKERCLATNKANGGVRMDAKLGVRIRPPKTAVNEHNKAYLQFLDVLDMMDKAPVDAAQPYALLAEYVERKALKYEQLLSLADRYYGSKAILRLAHAANKGDTQ